MVGHMGTIWPMTPAVDPVNGKEPRIEATTSRRSGAGWQPFTRRRWKPQSTGQFNYYVPIGSGSHDFKFGWDWQIDSELRGNNTNSGAVRYLDDANDGRPHNVDRVYLVGVPNLVENPNMHADFFAQDVWTVNNRLTITLGFRVGSQILSYLDSDNVPGSPCDEVLQCQFELPGQPVADAPGASSVGAPRFRATTCSLTGTSPRGWASPTTSRAKAPRSSRRIAGRYYANIGTGLLSANPGGQANATYEFLDQNMNGVLDDTSELGERLSFTAGAGLWNATIRSELVARVCRRGECRDRARTHNGPRHARFLRVQADAEHLGDP